MAEMTRRYLIAYDIADDRRRSKIADFLGSHGDRLQYSVFLVDARPARLIRLKATLAQMITFSEDSLLICDLGQPDHHGQQALQFLGQRRSVTADNPMIF